MTSGPTPGTFQARCVPEGLPSDPCRYGVISLSEGVEVCRVWNQEDARRLQDLLNLPNTRAADEVLDQIEIYRLIKRSGARRHGEIAKVIADALRISAQSRPEPELRMQPMVSCPGLEPGRPWCANAAPPDEVLVRIEHHEDPVHRRFAVGHWEKDGFRLADGSRLSPDCSVTGWASLPDLDAELPTPSATRMRPPESTGTAGAATGEIL